MIPKYRAWVHWIGSEESSKMCEVLEISFWDKQITVKFCGD